jgi:hypothetical protein
MEDVREKRQLAKRINAYAKEYAKAMLACEVPVPSGGDCWGCRFVDTKTGKTVTGNDHLASHLEERYYVPSLLMNAVKAFPVGMLIRQVIGYIWSGDYSQEDVRDTFGYIVDIAGEQITASVRKYMRREMEL